jgi:hypothetical protein
MSEAAHRKCVMEFSDQSVAGAWEATYLELASRQ